MQSKTRVNGQGSGARVTAAIGAALRPIEQAAGPGTWLLLCLSIALAYGLAAQLGFALAISSDRVTFVWPPSGLALAVLLLYGWRVLPGVALGMLGTNLGYVAGFGAVTLPALGMALALSVGSLVQAMAATALCQKVLQPDRDNSINRAVVRYAGAVALACCVAATVGVGSLLLRRLIDADSASATWWVWWVGDTAGMLSVAPAVTWWRLRAGGANTNHQPAAAALPGARLAPLADSAFPVVCMGLGLCMMIVMIVGHMERQFRLTQFRQEASTLVLAVEKNLALSQRDLQSLQSFYYKVDIDESEFLTTTRPLLSHHPWQRAFAWAAWQHGEPSRTPAGDSLSLTYVNPLPLRPGLMGMDLLQLPRDSAPMRRALLDGEPGAVVTAVWQGASPARPAVLMFWPVRSGAYQTKQLQDTRPVHGMSLLLLDVEALLTKTCAELRCRAQALHLFEAGQPDAALVSLAKAPRRDGLAPMLPIGLPQATTGAHTRHDIHLTNLSLSLVQRADASGLPWGLSGLQLGVLVAGLGFTSVLAAYLAQRRRAEQVVVDANQQLEGQVSQRTAELSGANIALQAQVRERQRAEEALRMFRWFADGADQALGIADFQRRVVYLNPAMRTFADLPADARVEGIDILELYPAVRHAQITGQIWPLLKAGGQWTGELQLDTPRRLRSDGPTLTHLIESFFVLRDDAGAPQLVASILTDISALKQLEGQVQRARAAAEEANQAKSAFLANMSHEIRTPLNAVLGYTQLMREDGALALQHRERLGSVLSAGQRLLGLINDILDLSKIEAGAMSVFARPFDLRAELHELGELMGGRAEARQLAFALAIDLPQPAHVLGDRAKLGQMLLNLLGNAIKFTESGQVGLKVWQDGDALCFEVSDTGPGISGTELATLFAPFRQGDSGQAKGGTGLGLSITRRLAQLMGGELRLHSTPGLGTQALLRLPLPYTDQPVAPGAQQQRAQGRLRLLQPPSLRVLVAEDDPDSSQVLCSLLRQLGCSVTVCEDGAQALAAVRAAAPQAAPEIVFTDIRMPVMNGLELLAALRAAAGPQRLPVVAVSASSMEHQRAHFLAQGFDDFVGKPYAFEDIYRALEQHAGVTLGMPGSATADEAGEVAMPGPSARAATHAHSGGTVETLDTDGIAALEALAQASAEGDLGQVRAHWASLSAEQLGSAHATMAAALASYDLERLELLARQALAAQVSPDTHAAGAFSATAEQA